MDSDVIIVGGGLAAVRTAQELRDRGHTGRVVLVSGEAVLPYDRPPLSKDYLRGRLSDEAIGLIAADDLARLDIDVRLGTPACGLDRAESLVLMADGTTIAYDRLVIATGATPRRLPMLDGRDNVIALRSAQDSRRLRGLLKRDARVAVVGAGFIGLEVAAVSSELGCEVTVIEAADTPLAGVLGTELGALVQRFHEDRGVAFRCGATVLGALGNGRIEALELADGTLIPADAIVVGVGVSACVDWLRHSGLELHHGLVCDVAGRTADPKVFGAGDVVCRHFDGACHPTGHWTAAGDQARTVAGLICGEDPGPLVEDNYFWSDQFDARLQFAGVVPAHPRISYVAGDPEADKFVALCATDEHVTAVFSLNSPRDFIRQSMPLRRGELIPAPA